MRIGFLGDGEWGRRALAQLASDLRYTIVFAAVRASMPDQDLIDVATAHRIPVITPAKINTPESVAEIAAFGAELHVSMSYDQILREEILAVPPRGTLNCHAGALPFYRGRNPLTWALINGETEFGITVHWVDLGIDTGDIVLQVKVPIGPKDTYASLLRIAEQECADVLARAVAEVHAGKAQRVAQSSIDPVGLYCCRRREGDEEIDWTTSAVQIDRFVRALVPPGPGARTSYREKPYAVLAAETIAGARDYLGIAGEIIGADRNGILVKTGDSFIRLTSWAEVMPDGSVGAAKVPSAPRGQRLGRDLKAEIQRAEARIRTLERQLGSGRGD
jgi:methionyl-tRNA formyltransferase